MLDGIDGLAAIRYTLAVGRICDPSFQHFSLRITITANVARNSFWDETIIPDAAMLCHILWLGRSR